VLERDRDIRDFRISNLLWDPIYVSDVIDAICRCIATPAVWGQTVNISGGVPYTPLQVFRQVMLLVHDDPDLVKCKVENDGYYPSLGDTRLAKKILNWRPNIGLSEGLEFIVNEYLKCQQR